MTLPPKTFTDLLHFNTYRRLGRVTFAMVVVAGGVLAADIVLHRRGFGSGQEMMCAYTSRCLPSYGNTRECELLSVGTSEKELFFRLGQPIGGVGTTLYFQPGAGKRGPISIELDADRKAIRFACRPVK